MKSQIGRRTPRAGPSPRRNRLGTPLGPVRRAIDLARGASCCGAGGGQDRLPTGLGLLQGGVERSGRSGQARRSVGGRVPVSSVAMTRPPSGWREGVDLRLRLRGSAAGRGPGQPGGPLGRRGRWPCARVSANPLLWAVCRPGEWIGSARHSPQRHRSGLDADSRFGVAGHGLADRRSWRAGGSGWSLGGRRDEVQAQLGGGRGEVSGNCSVEGHSGLAALALPAGEHGGVAPPKLLGHGFEVVTRPCCPGRRARAAGSAVAGRDRPAAERCAGHGVAFLLGLPALAPMGRFLPSR